jgi:hypothetical protein
METNGLTQVGGLLKEAFTSSLNGFDDLGADYTDTPTQDLASLRKGLFSFVAQEDNPTVSFNTGNQTNTFYFTGGFTAGVTGSAVTATLTGITTGTYITVQCDAPVKFGFSNVSSTGGLGDEFEVYWDGLIDASSIDIKDLGATRPILSSMDNSFTKLDLRGNSISGDFPDDVTVSDNLYIQGNQFSGELPTFSNSMQRYQVNDNKFRGGIPDISSSTSIRSFLVYNQSDDTLDTNRRAREMLTGTIPDLSGCTQLSFFHVGAGPSWASGFRNRFSIASDFDVPVTLSKFFASNCNIPTEGVDKILLKFSQASTTSPNIIDLSGTNGYPTEAGLGYRDTLVAAGWTVKLPAIK